MPITAEPGCRPNPHDAVHGSRCMEAREGDQAGTQAEIAECGRAGRMGEGTVPEM